MDVVRKIQARAGRRPQDRTRRWSRRSGSSRRAASRRKIVTCLIVAVIGASNDSPQVREQGATGVSRAGLHRRSDQPARKTVSKGSRPTPACWTIRATIDEATVYVPPEIGVARDRRPRPKKRIKTVWLNPGADGAGGGRRAPGRSALKTHRRVLDSRRRRGPRGCTDLPSRCRTVLCQVILCSWRVLYSFR